jgi:Zn-dependent peptidase ImmA (M78 family)
MAHAVLISEMVLAIEQHAKLPDLDLPDHTIDPNAPIQRVEEIAMDVREEWELGLEPIENVVREIEAHGGVAVRLELADDVDAFSWPTKPPRRPIVILGSDKDVPNRSRFDAAHELGHLLMHFDHPKPDDRALETQAHRFAGAFLLPAEQLEQEWPAGRLRWPELLELKQRWQVSLAALLYRARQLDLISDSNYLSAIKYMSRAGWRRNEPGDIGSPERPRLLRQAVRALADTGFELDQLATEARLPVKELSDYLNTPGSRARIDITL